MRDFAVCFLQAIPFYSYLKQQTRCEAWCLDHGIQRSLLRHAFRAACPFNTYTMTALIDSIKGQRVNYFIVGSESVEICIRL